MVDRGQVFSAQAMTRMMVSTVYKHFIVSQAWRDGVPGMLRAGILVGFKFYVWSAFWQASGCKRLQTDDKFVGRIGIAMELIRHAVYGGSRIVRILGRVRQV